MSDFLVNNKTKNNKDPDWQTKDDLNDQLYSVKDNTVYVESANLDLNNNPLKVFSLQQLNNYDSSFPRELCNLITPIGFSKELSGKSVIIQGGELVASLNGTQEIDIVYIKGVIPKGVCYLELVCPYSCKNMSIGMTDSKDKSEYVLDNLYKNTFKTFNTTTKRSIQMQINYDKETVDYFLEGNYKCSSEFSISKKEFFPAILLSSTTVSVSLNPGACKHSSLCNTFNKITHNIYKSNNMIKEVLFNNSKVTQNNLIDKSSVDPENNYLGKDILSLLHNKSSATEIINDLKDSLLNNSIVIHFSDNLLMNVLNSNSVREVLTSLIKNNDSYSTTLLNSLIKTKIDINILEYTNIKVVLNKEEEIKNLITDSSSTSKSGIYTCYIAFTDKKDKDSFINKNNSKINSINYNLNSNNEEKINCFINSPNNELLDIVFILGDVYLENFFKQNSYIPYSFSFYHNYDLDTIRNYQRIIEEINSKLINSNSNNANTNNGLTIKNISIIKMNLDVQELLLTMTNSTNSKEREKIIQALETLNTKKTELSNKLEFELKRDDKNENKDKNFSNNIDNKNLTIEYLANVDKLLLTKDNKAKLLSRNSTGDFNFEFIYNESQSDINTNDKDENNILIDSNSNSTETKIDLIIPTEKITTLLKEIKIKEYFTSISHDKLDIKIQSWVEFLESLINATNSIKNINNKSYLVVNLGLSVIAKVISDIHEYLVFSSNYNKIDKDYSKLIATLKQDTKSSKEEDRLEIVGSYLKSVFNDLIKDYYSILVFNEILLVNLDFEVNEIPKITNANSSLGITDTYSKRMLLLFNNFSINKEDLYKLEKAVKTEKPPIVEPLSHDLENALPFYDDVTEEMSNIEEDKNLILNILNSQKAKKTNYIPTSTESQAAGNDWVSLSKKVVNIEKSPSPLILPPINIKKDVEDYSLSPNEEKEFIFYWFDKRIRYLIKNHENSESTHSIVKDITKTIYDRDLKEHITNISINHFEKIIKLASFVTSRDVLNYLSCFKFIIEVSEQIRVKIINYSKNSIDTNNYSSSRCGSKLASFDFFSAVLCQINELSLFSSSYLLKSFANHDMSIFNNNQYSSDSVVSDISNIDKFTSFADKGLFVNEANDGLLSSIMGKTYLKNIYPEFKSFTNSSSSMNEIFDSIFSKDFDLHLLSHISPIVENSYSNNALNFIPNNNKNFNDENKINRIKHKVISNTKPMLMLTSEQKQTSIYDISNNLNKLVTFNANHSVRSIKELYELPIFSHLEIQKDFEDPESKTPQQIKSLVKALYFITETELTTTKKKEKKAKKHSLELKNESDSNSKSKKTTVKEVVPDQVKVNNLYSMGFPLEACKFVLKENKNDLDKSLEYLLEKSQDKEFMMKFVPKAAPKQEQKKIPSWQCEQCTYLNEPGVSACEMCMSPVPKKVLKEFEEDKTKQEENLKKKEKEDEHKKEEEKRLMKELKKKEAEEAERKRIEEEKKAYNQQKHFAPIIYDKYSLEKVHLIYCGNKNTNNNVNGSSSNINCFDSLCPVIGVFILFDNIKNDVIVNSYKFMFHPGLIKEFISPVMGNAVKNVSEFNEDNVIGWMVSIDNSVFNKFEEAVNHLLNKHYTNVISIYYNSQNTTFFKERKSDSDINKNCILEALIPVEFSTVKITNVEAFCDSSLLENNLNNSNFNNTSYNAELNLLLETQKNTNTIIKIQILNKPKFVNNSIIENSVFIRFLNRKDTGIAVLNINDNCNSKKDARIKDNSISAYDFKEVKFENLDYEVKLLNDDIGVYVISKSGVSLITKNDFFSNYYNKKIKNDEEGSEKDDVMFINFNNFNSSKEFNIDLINNIVPYYKKLNIRITKIEDNNSADVGDNNKTKIENNTNNEFSFTIIEKIDIFDSTSGYCSINFEKLFVKRMMETNNQLDIKVINHYSSFKEEDSTTIDNEEYEKFDIKGKSETDFLYLFKDLCLSGLIYLEKIFDKEKVAIKKTISNRSSYYLNENYYNIHNICNTNNSEVNAKYYDSVVSFINSNTNNDKFCYELQKQASNVRINLLLKKIKKNANNNQAITNNNDNKDKEDVVKFKNYKFNTKLNQSTDYQLEKYFLNAKLYINHLPLKVTNYTASLASNKVNANSMLLKAERYVSNYTKPSFLLSHIDSSKVFSVSSVFIQSDLSSAKPVNIPFQSGALFLCSDLSTIDKAYSIFSNYREEDFKNFFVNSNNNNDDIDYTNRQEHLPIAYIELDTYSNSFVNFENNLNLIGRYLLLMTVSGRKEKTKLDQEQKDFTDMKAISINCFSVLGNTYDKSVLNNLCNKDSKEYYIDKEINIIDEKTKEKLIEKSTVRICKKLAHPQIIDYNDEDNLYTGVVDIETSSFMNNACSDKIEIYFKDFDQSSNKSDFELVAFSLEAERYKDSKSTKSANTSINNNNLLFSKNGKKLIIDKQDLLLSLVNCESSNFIKALLRLLSSSSIENSNDNSNSKSDVNSSNPIKNTKLSILHFFKTLISLKPSNSVIKTISEQIDFKKFIILNILKEKNILLVNSSLDFLFLLSTFSKANKELISHSLTNILENLFTIETMTPLGIVSFFKLIEMEIESRKIDSIIYFFNVFNDTMYFSLMKLSLQLVSSINKNKNSYSKEANMLQHYIKSSLSNSINNSNNNSLLTSSYVLDEDIFLTDRRSLESLSDWNNNCYFENTNSNVDNDKTDFSINREILPVMNLFVFDCIKTHIEISTKINPIVRIKAEFFDNIKTESLLLKFALTEELTTDYKNHHANTNHNDLKELQSNFNNGHYLCDILTLGFTIRVFDNLSNLIYNEVVSDTKAKIIFSSISNEFISNNPCYDDYSNVIKARKGQIIIGLNHLTNTSNQFIIEISSKYYNRNIHSSNGSLINEELKSTSKDKSSIVIFPQIVGRIEKNAVSHNKENTEFIDTSQFGHIMTSVNFENCNYFVNSNSSLNSISQLPLTKLNNKESVIMITNCKFSYLDKYLLNTIIETTTVNNHIQNKSNIQTIDKSRLEKLRETLIALINQNNTNNKIQNQAKERQINLCLNEILKTQVSNNKTKNSLVELSNSESAKTEILRIILLIVSERSEILVNNSNVKEAIMKLPRQELSKIISEVENIEMVELRTNSNNDTSNNTSTKSILFNFTQSLIYNFIIFNSELHESNENKKNKETTLPYLILNLIYQELWDDLSIKEKNDLFDKINNDLLSKDEPNKAIINVLINIATLPFDIEYIIKKIISMYSLASEIKDNNNTALSNSFFNISSLFSIINKRVNSIYLETNSQHNDTIDYFLSRSVTEKNILSIKNLIGSNFEFITLIKNNKTFPTQINNLLLESSLNLMLKCYESNSTSLEKKNSEDVVYGNSEIIEFFIKTLLSQRENPNFSKLKSKFLKVIFKLIDPNQIESNSNVNSLLTKMDITSITNQLFLIEKVIVIIQDIAIEQLTSLDDIKNNNDENIRKTREGTFDKFEIVLSLLVKSYSLRSILKSNNSSNSVKYETILINNSLILEKFISVLNCNNSENKNQLLSDTKSFSKINELFDSLLKLLEKSSLDLLLHNNNLFNLIINIIENFKPSIVELLLVKLLNIITHLYFTKTITLLNLSANYKSIIQSSEIKTEISKEISKEEEIITNFYSEVLRIINHCLNNYMLTQYELTTSLFLNNLIEIVLFDNIPAIVNDNITSKANNYEIKPNALSDSDVVVDANLSSFNATIFINKTKEKLSLFNKVEAKTKNEFMILISEYMIKYFNLGSYTGVISSDKKYYIRSSLFKNLTFILEIISFNVISAIDTSNWNSNNDNTNKEENKILKTNDFSSLTKTQVTLTINNFIIWVILNNYDQIPNLAIVLSNISKGNPIINSTIDHFINNKKLVEIVLVETMKIVRNIDEKVFEQIKTNKICLRKGIVICEKLFNALEEILHKCLIDDEITKFFAFELQGFKFFIDRVNTHKNKQGKIILNKQSKTCNSPDSNELSLTINNDLFESLTNSNLEEHVPENTNINSTLINVAKIEKQGTEEYFAGKIEDYKYEELAVINKISILEGTNFEKPKTKLSNYDWSQKKKGVNGALYIRHMKPETTSTEEVFMFMTNNTVEIKDVQIGFSFNITNISDKVSGLVDCVFLEAGESLDKFDICIKLQQVKDISYLDKGVISFGFNFFALNSEIINYNNIKDCKDIDDNKNYLNELLNSIVNCRAKYFKFTVRRPLLTSNENTHSVKLSNNKLVIGVSYLSLLGLKLVDSVKVIDHIQELEKNISIKIISKIFTGEFIDTLKFLANDETTINYVMQIYDAFEPYIEQHADILSNILINVSKYSFTLGEWLLNRLLNYENSDVHAKLAVEIVQNNEQYLNQRLNKYLDFCLTQLDEIRKEFNDNSSINKSIVTGINSEIILKSTTGLAELSNINAFSSNDENTEFEREKKLINIGKFIYYFTLVINGLLCNPYIKVNNDSKDDDISIINDSPISNNKLCIDLDIEMLLNILTDVNCFSNIEQEILRLTSILLLPNNHLKINIHKASTRFNNNDFNLEKVIDYLHSCYQESYIFEYAEILSVLVSHSDEAALICHNKNIFIFYCEELISQVVNKIRGKNMIFLINILKNFSYSKIFVNVVYKNEYDFKILEILKRTDINGQNKNQSILINNSIEFLNSLVIFLKNCIIPFPKSHKKIASILINDLEVCKNKIDKLYANKVLIPLLRMEETINVCVHPIDSTNKLSSSMYLNHKYRLSSIINNNINNTQQAIKDSLNKKPSENNGKCIIKNSTLISNEVNTIFTQLYKNHNYEKDKKFIHTEFELAFSSRSFRDSNPILKTKFTDSSNLLTTIETIFNTGIKAFLLVCSGNDNTQTFFYANTHLPNIQTNNGNLESLDKNISSELYIEFTKQNFICQIKNNDYICGNFSIEINDITGKEYELGNIYLDSYGASLSIVSDFINLNLNSFDNSTISPFSDEVKITEKKGFTEYVSSDIKDWELYIAHPISSSQLVKTSSNLIEHDINKQIVATRLIDGQGNLNESKVKMTKYYSDNNTIDWFKDNPIFEIPSQVCFSKINDFFVSNNTELMISDLDNKSNKKVKIVNNEDSLIKDNNSRRSQKETQSTNNNQILISKSATLKQVFNKLKLTNSVYENNNIKNIDDLLSNFTVNSLINSNKTNDSSNNSNIIGSSDIMNSEEYDKLVNINKNSNCIDISFDISQLRRINLTQEDVITVFNNYEAYLPVFNVFEDLNGIKMILSVLSTTISYWKCEKAQQFWLKWIDDVKKFSELPLFFISLIRHQKCFDIIFNLLCGIYDEDTFTQNEIYKDSIKYIYEILKSVFESTESQELRLVAIEKGILNTILERLQLLTHEKPRKFEENIKEEKELEVIEEVNEDAEGNAENKEKDSKEKESADKKLKSKEKKKVIAKKGVGYGSDHTGDNKAWDVSGYIEGKKTSSDQIGLIVSILAYFFNFNIKSSDIDSTQLLKTASIIGSGKDLTTQFRNIILESIILPCIESALRGGTLLEMSKEENLYYSYLDLILKFSNNQDFISLLLDIPKNYIPTQSESIYSLLTALNNVGKIFLSAVVSGVQKSTEEKLAAEIQKTYDAVSKNIEHYKDNYALVTDYNAILKLPIEKSYPLLLKDLTFGYMNMRDAHGKLVHIYSSSLTSESSSTKLIRLAQEYADLSRSLPAESTNAIYVRVDKNNMDYMKVLIMGSSGTPYSHGAFEYDVYFDSQYPNGPPKVTLVTTGAGAVRFNPNLYANGKVCLSLLGTWRGQSTENWDPKISTLLQVLISIQSIIMSDLVYFNEPSCESEMGKPEGEAKNEAYSNIVRYCNIKYAMLEQIKKPSPGFEEVIQRHFYLQKENILKEAKEWIERSKTAEAKYSSFSYDHNVNWAQKFTQPKNYTKALEEIFVELEEKINNLPIPSGLKQKAEESDLKNEELKQKKKKEEESKKNEVNFLNLDNVDVGYDEKKEGQDKEMNVDDDAVKDRWSRYIGAMGIESVKKQASASVFLSGATAMGIEIAKNVVLSGCKKFVLHDTYKTSVEDLSGQFFLSEEDIGKPRAESCLRRLKELNYYVKINANTQILPESEKEIDEFFKEYNVVILTNCSYSTAIKINKYCRKNNIAFIFADLFGVFGRIFNDFGDNFSVFDKNGEELEDVMFKCISNDKEGIVTVMEGTKHPYEDGDFIIISEVDGMELTDNSVQTLKSISWLKLENDENTKDQTDKNIKLSINNTIHKVKVIDSKTFKIGDTSMFGKYKRNGKCKHMKMESKLNFKDMETVFNDAEFEGKYIDMNMSISDFSKMSHAKPTHIGFEALDIFKLKENKAPDFWSIKDQNSLVSYAKNLYSTKYKSDFESLDNQIISYISFTNKVQFPPLAAYFGGFIAQEIVKAITGKFTPTNQLFYYNSMEILPKIEFALEIKPKNDNEKNDNKDDGKDKIEEVKKVYETNINKNNDYVDKQIKEYFNESKLNTQSVYINTTNSKDKAFNYLTSRCFGLRCIVGDQVLNYLKQVNIFVVGAGAIGCELLKNFAMLELGTANDKDKQGKIIVTDPDIIEPSNLNRQFLFREKHLRMQKSGTAAAAICAMNKNLKGHVYAQIDKVCTETEHFFSDKFFQSLTLVANALDNVKARRYVDARCVANRIPLLESGTLGPKGHVQVILPFKTESYSSQADPEVTNDIPQCTLKMFPEEAMHCVEWARDRFGKMFSLKPKNMTKVIDEGVDNQEYKIIKQCLKAFSKRPFTFEDCVLRAREYFEKFFSNDLKQLMVAYPLDKKNKDGSLFWSLPKRPPVWLNFNKEDSLHQEFIMAYSCLTAKLYSIIIPYSNPRSQEARKDIINIAAGFKIAEFVPNKKKVEALQKELEKENKEKEDKANKNEDKNKMIVEEDPVDEGFDKMIEDLKSSIKDYLGKNDNKASFRAEEFEKDDDTNFHIDFIHSMASLRCRNYKLDEMDWLTVKIKAGRIIPALATTTASIAGLQALELVKIVKNMDLEQFRNYFLNLAVPLMQASEPGEALKFTLRKDPDVTVNLWDRWEITLKEPTLKTIFNHLIDKYHLYPKDCFQGKKAIYSYAAYSGEDKKNLNNEILNKNLKKMIDFYEDSYADLTITFTLKEEDQEYLKNTPIVRVILDNGKAKK